MKSIRSSLLAMHALLVYAILYGPILVLMALSFNKSRQAAVWTGFSFDWYVQLANDAEVVHDAWHSLIVALVATGASTVIGTMAALGLASTGRKFAAAAPCATTTASDLPADCHSRNRHGSRPSDILFHYQMASESCHRDGGHISFTVSYVAIIVRARLSGFDGSLEEAAMDLAPIACRPSFA